MSFLITADTHLTDQGKDAYRFDIFKWLRKQQKEHRPDATFILGDLTAQKDKHSSFLTNKLVEGIISLEPPVFILKGNHDYIDPDFAFFKFLRHIEGVAFVSVPTRWHDIGLIPHIRDQKEFDKAVGSFNNLDYLFIHQCVEGAIAETGAHLSGTSTSAIEKNPPRLGVYAGDIHRPQRAGIVTYVGAPYHVRFGDDFDPRVLLLHKDGKYTNLHFDKCPRKWSITIRDAEEIIENQELFEGDHIKVTVELAREEAVDWRKHKDEVLEACRQIGLQVFGVDLKVNTLKQRKTKTTQRSTISPMEVVSEFCSHEHASSKVKEAGIRLVKA